MIRLLYIGGIGDRTGFGQAGRDHLMALLRYGGSDLEIGFPPPKERLTERYRSLNNCTAAGTFFWPTHVLIHKPHFMLEPMWNNLRNTLPSSVKRIFMTTWETQNFPSKYEHLLHDMDAIWVPSIFSRDVLPLRYREKVTVVPHPYDPEWWGLTKVPARNERYTFYNISTWASLKNLDDLIRVFCSAFFERKDVCLRIRADENPQALARLIWQLQLPPEKLPPIEFVPPLSDEGLRELHHTSNCYVTLTHGEGFGLGAYEAMLMGSKVIASNVGGLPDFLDAYGGGVLLPGSLAPALAPLMEPKYAIRDGNLVEENQAYLDGGVDGTQWWFQPDLNQADLAMEYAPECIQEIYPHACTWTYEAIGKQMRKSLEEL